MAEYTYKDIIIDPTSEEAKNAVGKEVYFADTPASCLNAAKNNNKAYLGYLKKLDLGDEEQPFYVNEFVVSAPSSWTCIIVKKEPSYSERAKKWVEANDIKVGDYVKVTRKANENEHGWKGLWLDDMDESVAKTLMVKDIGICDNNIGLEDDYYYPYFVLEKIELPKPEYVPFESKEEFIEAFHYHDNAKYSETDDILMNYGMWLWSNEDGSYKLVTEIWNAGVVIGDDKMRITNEEGHIDVFNDTTSWVKLFSEYRFLDGSPCGKEVKDE